MLKNCAILEKLKARRGGFEMWLQLLKGVDVKFSLFERLN